MAAMEQFIIDGDWGGDEMQLAAVLLAQPERAHILGATSVFGNAALTHGTNNARDLLHFLNASDIPVYEGAACPTGEQPPKGDDAHGDTGLGTVKLAPSPAPRTQKSAVDFILETLRTQPEHSVTITATGPLTNIAQAFEQDPATMRRVKRVIAMGGCLRDLPARDMPIRRGNITPHAEFNAYMAPQDANTVFGSGLPITLVPMDCSQQLAFSIPNRSKLTHALKRNPTKMRTIERLSCAADWIDQQKFGSNQFMHDVHCALIALYPELYSTDFSAVEVTTQGAMRGFTMPLPGADITVARALEKPDTAFDIVVESLKHCIIAQRQQAR